MEHFCQKEVMHLAELTVIYLAYGAPFGVYELSCARKKPSLPQIHLIAASFVFWPVILGSWIWRWFLRGQPSAILQLENKLDLLRDDLEEIAFGDRSAAAILRFREVYARYAGLTLLLMSKVDSPGRHPLLELRHDVATKGAAACLHRRDRQKIAIHQRQARAEFLVVIAWQRRRNGDFRRWCRDEIDQCKPGETRGAQYCSHHSEQMPAIEPQHESFRLQAPR